MGGSTDLYVKSAKAFNNFFNMLHLAILESMASADISGDGASFWRGYRIDSYKTLAKGLFCCQIYTEEPNILVFQEGYKYSKYKPIDPRDKFIAIFRWIIQIMASRCYGAGHEKTEAD